MQMRSPFCGGKAVYQLDFPAILLLVGMLLLMAFCAPNSFASSQQTYSKHGRFLVTLELPDPLDQLNHEIPASLIITDGKGKPIQPQRITIGGGMKSHGHGLSTQPKIDQYLERGRWRIAGLEFSMRGSWQLLIQLLDERGWDWVRYDISVGKNLGLDFGNTFSKQEIRLLQSLTLSSLKAASDPTNLVLHNADAAELGRKLFYDKRLAAASNLSCASCHQPDLVFTDGRKLGQGKKALNKNVPTLIGVSHQKWFYSDGRRDSLWSQSITPIEAESEMGATRSEVLSYFFSIPGYKKGYQALFGHSPDLSGLPLQASPVGTAMQKKIWKEIPIPQRREYNSAFANIGRLLAAYQAKIEPVESRFDRYVYSLASSIGKNTSSGEKLLSDKEIKGLKVFLNSKNRCLSCHNGPLFSNGQFHNIGTRRASDLGRRAGSQAVRYDPFNCQGRYSGVPREKCRNLIYMANFDASYYSAGAFKTPSLRDIQKTFPYMHDGSKANLTEVIEHYRHPPEGGERHELLPISITSDEADALIAFLKTLSGDKLLDNTWRQSPYD